MRMPRWSIDELVMLSRHYPTKPASWIAAEFKKLGVARSVDSINCKASNLGLHKVETYRQDYQRPLRARVISIILRDTERTIKQIHHETKSPVASIFKILGDLKRQKNVHIARWCRSRTGCPQAVYRVGAGRSRPKPKPRYGKSASVAKKPTARKPRPAAIRQVEFPPIPTPTLGPWGLCWTSSNAGTAGRKEQAAA